MTEQIGRSPDGSGSRPSDGAASTGVSTVPASIPNAARHEERISHLLELKGGWDSYRGSPISRDAIDMARPFIARLDALGLEPWISPMSCGGIMLERAGKPDNYSFEFLSNGEVSVLLDHLAPEQAMALLECAAASGMSAGTAETAQQAQGQRPASPVGDSRDAHE